MNLTTISKGITKLTGRTGLILGKHSPTILLVVGVAGVVASSVMACRATLKVEAVVAEHNDKVDKIHDTFDKAQNSRLDYTPEHYTAEDKQKDLVTVYAQTAWEFIKLYGPSVVLGVASIGCIVGGHGILNKRNVALAAAYKAAEEGFKEYRKRVVEEYGQDKDYMLRHGLKAEKVTETITDEKGKEKTVEKTVLTRDTNAVPSIYARYYDSTCLNWSRDPEMNRFFLYTTQCYWNDLLQIRGHVFLNEVYDSLGIPRTSAGQAVGWLKDQGDGFIDFGIFEAGGAYRHDRVCDTIGEERRDFVNGYRSDVLLDFNVDGSIYDRI